MAEDRPRKATERCLLTSGDVPRMLAISTRQLRGLVRDGALPYINVGLGAKLESRRFDPADVTAFIESRKQFAFQPQPSPRLPPSHVRTIDFTARRAERKAEKERKRGAPK